MSLEEEILKLKKEKDAVILAHYYVRPEVQAIADYVGDSFYLSKVATELSNSTIVFCGVSFMGESAKLLNRSKKVLMPDIMSDCPMAHMVTKEIVDKARETYDDLSVVCYINSTAEIKSWSDVCVTSANALNIVKKLPGKNILFIPDRNLAHYIADKLPEKHFVFNEGYCPIHENMKACEIKKLIDKYPAAKVLVHPECNPEIIKLADYIGSTSGIINYAAESECDEFIIGTEEGVSFALNNKRPDAKFYFPETTPVCTDMKLITLEKICDVLENEDNEVQDLDVDVKEAAAKSLSRMLELGK